MACNSAQCSEHVCINDSSNARSGILEQALLGVLQLAMAPLAAQLVAVEAELARLRGILESSSCSVVGVSQEQVKCRSCGNTGLDFMGQPCSCSYGQRVRQEARAAVHSNSAPAPNDCRGLPHADELGNSATPPNGAVQSTELPVDTLDAIGPTGGVSSAWPSCSTGKPRQEAGVRSTSPLAQPWLHEAQSILHAEGRSSAEGPDRHKRASSAMGLVRRPADEDIIGATVRVREDGNALFRKRDYDAAAQHFAMAINELSERPVGSAGWTPARSWLRIAAAQAEQKNIQGAGKSAHP